MKRLIIYLLTYLFLLFTVTFFSCEDKEIKVSSDGDKLVLGGIFFADSVLQMYLTKNHPLNANQVNIDIRIENAEVILYSGGDEVDRLEYVIPTQEEMEDRFWPSIDHSRYRSTSNFIPQAGVEYKIVVNAKGFTETVAYTKIPEKVEILDMQYSWEPEVVDISFDPWGGSHTFKGAPFSITFQDNPNTEDYYKIQCFSMRDFDYTHFNRWTEEEEHVVGEYLGTEGIRAKTSLTENVTEENPYTFSDKIMLSDEYFDGEKYTLDFYLAYRYEDNRPGLKIFDDEYRQGYSNEILFVGLQHITKAQYLYEVTLDEQALTFGDTFSEPVFIHTNVENGLGIFAGYSMTKSEDIIE